MDINFILVQAVGLIGSILAIAALQINNRKVILLTQFVCCILWMIHYYCLGAYTGMIINVVSMLRAIVFYNNEKAWAKNRIWLLVCCVLFALSPFIQWEAYYSLFPAIAMILTSLGLWSHNMKVTRLMFLINSPFMLIYNILCGSYSCAIIEAFALISFILAVYRFDIKKSNAEDL